jgi:hypothetical protein
MSASIDEPHFLQNPESSGFSNWHFGHFTVDALQRKKRKAGLNDKR